jgi:hypothetical protein
MLIASSVSSAPLPFTVDHVTAMFDAEVALPLHISTTISHDTLGREVEVHMFFAVIRIGEFKAPAVRSIALV